LIRAELREVKGRQGELEAEVEDARAARADGVNGTNGANGANGANSHGTNGHTVGIVTQRDGKAVVSER
jgi:hypothetical protein